MAAKKPKTGQSADPIQAIPPDKSGEDGEKKVEQPVQPTVFPVSIEEFITGEKLNGALSTGFRAYLRGQTHDRLMTSWERVYQVFLSK